MGPVYFCILQAKLVNAESVFHFYLRVSAEISPFVFAKEDPFLCTSLLSYFFSLAPAFPHDGVNHFNKLGLEAFSCLSRGKKIYNCFDFKGARKTAFCC